MATLDQTRDILERIDRYNRVAEAAETVRRHIRLHAPVAVRKGRLGWLRWFNRPNAKGAYEFQELTGPETIAVYEALSIVLARNREEAKLLQKVLEGDQT